MKNNMDILKILKVVLTNDPAIPLLEIYAKKQNHHLEEIFARSPVKVKVKATQSCLTFCDPMDYTSHGILQARILEWVAVPFSRGSSQPRDCPSPLLIAALFTIAKIWDNNKK